MSQKIPIEDREECVECSSVLRKSNKSLVTTIPKEVIKRLSLKAGDMVKYKMTVHEDCIDFEMEIVKE